MRTSILSASRLARLALGLLVPCLLLSLPVHAQKIDMSLLSDMEARAIGPATMSGRVTAIEVVNSNMKHLYVGTASGGVWESHNGGKTFKPIFDSTGAHSIGDIAVYQANPSIIYVGTGEGNPRNSQNMGGGIYKSIDGGKTWKLMGLEGTRTIHRVIIDPTNPNIVYAGAQGQSWGPNEERGVYKSTDGGATWEKILYVDDRTGVADMVMDPSNPNKIIVAMWEFKRWAWFFESGGKSSGLYITMDGGKNWKQLSSDDGLPKGDLGRIGLAFAPSNPSIVYALIEAKKNGFYKSTDGGLNWQLQSTDNSIGNRPFYYSDIRVDPTDANTVYSIFSTVSRTVDGGKNWEGILAYYDIHPDHHDWWINPNDPEHMMSANDGGLFVTEDGGDTWWQSMTLPVGQFYHIRVDNEFPYRVMGGLQDNGTFIGPSREFQSSGIAPYQWLEQYFGDGFDAMIDATDPNWMYAMSQGGMLGRVHIPTGNGYFLQPVHPDGDTLRFNWNAALAQDPFDKATIYYGSQFVHKSSDRGMSWQIISPDLTTDNKERQLSRDNIAGGLTKEATITESHTTILSIAPSPVRQGVMWVGTDDGNLQVTQDGGENWTNVAPNMKGVPAGAWFPHIHPSDYNAGEAFVIVNDYRRNHFAPYLMHTTDYGKTWHNLVSATTVEGYCLSVVQDPEEQKLLFLGTELGLYVSFDKGQTWNQWKHGFPPASTMDLAIQNDPHERDLVIGTFGRAIYVLDDIEPLRAIAREGAQVLQQNMVAFEPAEGFLMNTRRTPGSRFVQSDQFFGENQFASGVMFRVFLKESPEEMKKRMKEAAAQEAEPDEEADAAEAAEGEGMRAGRGSQEGAGASKDDSKLQIEIVDQAGEVVRHFSREVKQGLNQVYYYPVVDGQRRPGRRERPGQDPPSGPTLLPGTYKARFTYGDAMDSTMFVIKTDPRVQVNHSDLKQQYEMALEFQDLLAPLTVAIDQIEEAQASIKNVLAQIPEDTDDESLEALRDSSNAIQKRLKSVEELIRYDYPDPQAYVSSNFTLLDDVGLTQYSITGGMGPVPQTARERIDNFKRKLDVVLQEVNSFFNEEWPPYQEQVRAAPLDPFKPIRTLEPGMEIDPKEDDDE